MHRPTFLLAFSALTITSPFSPAQRQPEISGSSYVSVLPSLNDPGVSASTQSAPLIIGRSAAANNGLARLSIEHRFDRLRASLDAQWETSPSSMAYASWNSRASDIIWLVPHRPEDMNRPVIVRVHGSLQVNRDSSVTGAGDVGAYGDLVRFSVGGAVWQAQLANGGLSCEPRLLTVSQWEAGITLGGPTSVSLFASGAVYARRYFEAAPGDDARQTFSFSFEFAGLEVTDMLGQRLTDFTIESASGTDYNRASLPGDSPSNPELPAGSACGSRRAPGFSFPRARSGRWSDPPAAWAFDYRMDSGEVFTAIAELPMGLDRGAGYRVLVGEQDLGQFPGGARVDFSSFPGGGVRSFRIADIAPAEPNNPTAFPVRLDFNAEYAAFSMFPVVCLADHDGSGFIDADDFVGYLNDFSLGCVDVGQDAFGPNPSCSASADADESEFVDSDDFVEYVRLFELGC